MNRYCYVNTSISPEYSITDVSTDLKSSFVSKQRNPTPNLSINNLSAEINESFKPYNLDLKIPPIRYCNFRYRHITKKNPDIRISSESPPVLVKSFLQKSLINSSKISNRFSFTKKKGLKIRTLKFTGQAKVLPPAKTRVNYGIDIKPCLTFGEKVWRLHQIANTSSVNLAN